ncbi:Uncharacterised protein [Mycobacteroides abscessus subsp. abscessus]|nr:Uncharacterised protein [Mycobacteroides abscessus subsp. abscessus]
MIERGWPVVCVGDVVGECSCFCAGEVAEEAACSGCGFAAEWTGGGDRGHVEQFLACESCGIVDCVFDLAGQGPEWVGHLIGGA